MGGDCVPRARNARQRPVRQADEHRRRADGPSGSGRGQRNAATQLEIIRLQNDGVLRRGDGQPAVVAVGEVHLIGGHQAISQGAGDARQPAVFARRQFAPR
jgi:hypothetical protein